MYNYLIEHAVKNVWCSPDQDRQHIIRPTRITRPEGVWIKVKVLMKTFALPNLTDVFHVYQIGQLYPIILGFLPVKQTWINFADHCSQEHMILDVYSNKGIRYPNHLVWYRVTEDRNLIIAIAENKKIPIKLSEEDINVRFYSNAYYASIESQQIDDMVFNAGASPQNATDILNFQYRIKPYFDLPGMNYCFVNGFAVDAISLATVKPNDVVEFIHDGSIEKAIWLPIKDLQVFNSILDQRRKYLVHYAGNDSQRIDYLDDIDFFLMHRKTNGSYQGVYYHKNKADSVRMVTHRDYSIQVPYVVALNEGIPDSTDPDELVLRMLIRRSGYNRPLVFENNRIHELYKLKNADIVRAFAGIDSNVNNWKAEQLEMSHYSQVMAYKTNSIPADIVEKALGYNAISCLLGQTPTFARPVPEAQGSNLREVVVPYGLQENSTIFEYNQEGQLTGWYPHVIGPTALCNDNQTRLVEILSGTTGLNLDENYDLVGPIDPKASYRFYVSPIVQGVKQNKWEDVTNSSKYVITNNKFQWLISHSDYETIVRSDKYILSYDISYTMDRGIIYFALMQVQTIDGVQAARPLIIPPGEIDIFLNGRPIIQGLDYFVSFPYVAITNKEYLQNAESVPQLITIRAKGFCDRNLKFKIADDYGFVRNGLLSVNNRFDIRDDKVLRLIIDGQLKDRSDVVFSENHSGISVPSELNGRPYLLRDIVIPMRGLTPSDTYVLREASMAIDKVVSEYMTEKLPEPKMSFDYSIKERYQVYSPFCAKLIYDLKLRLLEDPRLYLHYSDTDVLDIAKPYTYLLPFDPCHDDNYPNDSFVMIHPHPLFTVIDLNAFAYKFVSRAVKVFLKDRVILSHFLRISD